MEGRKVIDTDSNVLEDLRNKGVDDANVRHLVRQLYEAISILERLKTTPQEYDEVDLERLVQDIYTYTIKIFRRTREKNLDRRFVPNKDSNLLTMSLSVIILLILVFYHTAINLHAPGVISTEERKQMRKELLENKDYIMLQELLRNGRYNPQFNYFYQALERDGSELPETIEQAIQFIKEGNYKSAAYSLDTVLCKIRGAVREI